MTVKEQSFVLKKGEGLHDKTLIKHKVLVPVDTAKHPSTVDTPMMTAAALPKLVYASPMARARHLARLRREATGSSDSTGASKEWDESLPSSSSPSTNSGSAVSSVTGTPVAAAASGSASTSSTKQRLIPSSGSLLIPGSGYIPKSGIVTGEETTSSHRLPKFGVWDNDGNDNKNGDDNGPCYTLLFENVAQEKRSGGPIRIHAPRPCSPSRNEDLYNYKPTSIKAARKTTRQYHSLLCCFMGS